MKKGQKMSDEQKAKIAKAHLGMKKPWSGLYMTQAHKDAISKREMGNTHCLGRKMSPETIEQIRQSNLGKKHNISEEGMARMKIKNYDVWNKGMPMKRETKDKLSLRIRGRKAPWMVGNKNIAGDKNPHYGVVGKDHPCWKDEKKRPFTKMLRQLHQYVTWRSNIFKRDNFSCVLCGISGVYVEADHFPDRFADILVEFHVKTLEDAIACKKLWDIKNGRTLCKKCHNPTKGRYKKS